MISLILTATVVSIDSFLCGFAFRTNKRSEKLFIVFLISLTVYLMSAVVNEFATIFSNFLTERTACLGGGILIISGAISMIKENTSSEQHLSDFPVYLNASHCQNYKSQAVLTGFAVGLDGAVANLSLAISGMNAFYVPLTIGVMHALAVYLGISMTQAKGLNRLLRYKAVPPFILMLLGFLKLKDFFL